MTWNIVCDSSCDLRPADFTGDAFSLEVIPLKIIIGGKEYVDDAKLSVPQMLADMEAEKSVSSTACPSPGAFAAAFQKADCSVCFTISGALSGTYNSAVMARNLVLEERPEKKICVIDSKGTAGMLILLINRAKQLIEAGGDFESISHALREYQASLRIVFTLSDFGNLIKAGRMNAFVGSVLTTLGIHVVANASSAGEIQLCGKARGEAKTLKAIVRKIAEMKDVTNLPIIISHCENLSGAMALKQLMLAELPALSISLIGCKGLCSYYAMEKGLLVSF